MTPSQERLIEDFRSALQSFEAFACFCRIYSEDGEHGYFNPETWHPEQIKFNEERTGRDIVVKSRQIGMSTMECMRDLYFALTNPGSTVLIVAQTDRTAFTLLKKCRDAYQHLIELGERAGIPLVPPLAEDKVSSFQIQGRGRIEADWSKAQERRANATGRGNTINRLHASEVALWEHDRHVAAALLKAAKRAKEIVLESTPQGASGFFYDFIQATLQKRAHIYTVHFYPFYIHKSYSLPAPRGFDPRPLDEYERLLRARGCDDGQICFWRNEIAETGVDAALRDYPIDLTLCFRASNGTFISVADLDYLASGVRQHIREWDIGGTLVRIWAEPQENRRYVLSLDPCHGGGDPASAYCLDMDTGEICASLADNTLVGSVAGDVISQIGLYYNNALIAIENRGGGETVLEYLMVTRPYYPLFQDQTKRHAGWHTDAGTRPMLFGTLAEAIRSRSIPICDSALIEELKSIVLDPKSMKIGAAKGKHDDRVMAYAIALRVRELSPGLTAKGLYRSITRNEVHPSDLGSFGNGKGFV